MNYITTTELRTKSSNLVESLLKGEEINLIHRSKVIGAIVPKEASQNKPVNPKRLAATLKKFEPKKKMTH